MFVGKCSTEITASLSSLVQILGHTTKKMMRSCRFSDTSHVFTLMVICFITLFSSSVHGQGKIRRFKWEVKYELKSPDCFEKLVITINGQFPGPTIKAQQGDTIIVELKNSFMTENVAVHWHGIRQVRTQSYSKCYTVLICLFFKKHITTFYEYLIPLMNNSVKKKHSMNTWYL